MFSFDELFERYDPCASLLAEVERDYSGVTPDTLGAALKDISSCRSIGREAAYRKLILHPTGADLRPVAIQAVHRAAVLVDVRQVFQVTAANAALDLASAQESANWPEWAQRQASRAVDACVNQERLGVEKNHDVAYPLADHYMCLKTVLDIPFENVRFATVSINDLPKEQRLPIVRVFLQGRSTGDLVVETQRTLDDLLASLQSGLEILMALQVDKER